MSLVLHRRLSTPVDRHYRGDIVIGQTDGRSIMACSALTRQMSVEHRDLLYSRQLCEDQKGVFEHLTPRRLLKSSLRVAVMQGTQVVTLYLNDQLKEDMTRDELVSKGKLLRREAEEEAEEWAEREWKRRWAAFPHKLAVAFGKYHSIILAMRVFEQIAARFVTKYTLDQLTVDTFESAKRSAKAGKEGSELAHDVFSTCWRANVISYLADYTIHQFILVFGYYAYVREQRRQRLKLEEIDDEKNEGVHGGSLALSLLKNSTLLAISRCVGLLCSSIGGACGSLVVPGWGTLAGANLGDGLAMLVSEEIVGPSAGAPLA